MDNILFSFSISGDFASFRKPDTTETYLTYNFIPRPAVLGTFGAVLGIPGYGIIHSALPKKPKKKSQEATSPRSLVLPKNFYHEFKSAYVGIAPEISSVGKTSVKYINFHGYGSKEEGGTLVITEQVLIRPRWKIWVFGDSTQVHKLYSLLYNRKCVFTPYLGKNEFRAEVSGITKYDSWNEITPTGSEEFASAVLLKDGIASSAIERSASALAPTLAEPIQIVEHSEKFSIFDNYPYALSANLSYRMATIAFSNRAIKTEHLSSSVKHRILSVGGENIFLFSGPADGAEL